MITATSNTRHLNPLDSTWQQHFADAVTDPAELLRALDLGSEWLAPAEAAAKLFPLRVPRSFVARMRRGDPHDPLLRQVLPLGDELIETEGFGSDPIDESSYQQAPGLLRKYSSRALLVTTGACAVHCRYCFRREFPYEEQQGETGRWREAIASVAADPSIEELILSGGDPLSLSNARLNALTNSLKGIAHLNSLRLHTRNAIVLPSRIDAGFIDWIRSLPWRVTIVLHVNHAQELQGDALEALARLSTTGALLLNQSVLLRGVNDDATALSTLSRTLHAHGVLPYYLHLLDRVRGSAHFEVSESRGLEIIATMTSTLPGYLVPKLVREIPGAASKTAIVAQA
ncbi:MAG: EF-P beta-lysylation protein EpmB [Gammaproteobacteria bacterium]|jgi:L-lysine 2,3-aminomutase|nr:EF-P beta-lysylation protein EpmB [Gammaproteobacteria bacterium]